MKDQFFSDSNGNYRVPDLLRVAKAKGPPKLLPVSVLEHNLEPSPMEAGEELPGHPDFIARANRANGKYPAIAVQYPDGIFLADGVHRLWKAKAKGEKYFLAYLIDEVDLAAGKEIIMNQ